MMDIVVYFDDGKVYNIDGVICMTAHPHIINVILSEEKVVKLNREDIASIKIYGGLYD